MFNFFKKKKNQSKKVNTTLQTFTKAPGTQIYYADNLIDTLIDDHKNLLHLFGQIQRAIDSKNYTLITNKLKAFRVALTDHLLTENVRLYVYLGHSLSEHDEYNASLVKEFRSEMNQIAKVVMSFIRKYETIGVDQELIGPFAKDLEQIGATLVERIQREEHTLYPLYLPC